MQLPRFLHNPVRWDRGACLRSSQGHGGPYATGGRHREAPLGTRKGYGGKPRLQGGGMRGGAGPCPHCRGQVRCGRGALPGGDTPPPGGTSLRAAGGSGLQTRRATPSLLPWGVGDGHGPGDSSRRRGEKPTPAASRGLPALRPRGVASPPQHGPPGHSPRVTGRPSSGAGGCGTDQVTAGRTGLSGHSHPSPPLTRYERPPRAGAVPGLGVQQRTRGLLPAFLGLCLSGETLHRQADR